MSDAEVKNMVGGDAPSADELKSLKRSHQDEEVDGKKQKTENGSNGDHAEEEDDGEEEEDIDGEEEEELDGEGEDAEDDDEEGEGEDDEEGEEEEGEGDEDEGE